ncbi:stage II sporulation protein R [Oscillibacter sp.]|uniref:stage II sporulation protein R n=1 Tax=Oscillibacter sp. TaxID=1945593 RepID=UPI00216FCEB8|nr:stage II sporulation protein R [Oscillibacter sp.]MCI9649717.1 stage II sporulation protein R [Oscillibacter sp.]
MKTAVTSRNKLKLVEIALLVGLAAFLASGGLALRAQTQLAERVVRLHVLANSDGEEDQELKLLVRDRVLARATELLTQAGNRAEAESLLRRELPELEALAARELRANGCDYPVTAELTDTEFPTREYDGFTLPAGEYLALRVVIGEGAGRNWWCVVFPPLCTAASAEVPAAALAAGLTEDQVGLITEEDRGYVLKFKTVEWWEQLRSQLAERGFAKS